jgi:hypothetical protein
LLACVTEFPEVFCLSDQVIELPTAEMVNAIENSVALEGAGFDEYYI